MTSRNPPDAPVGERASDGDPAPMKDDQKELLDRVLSGDPPAFEQFLDRYRSLVFSVFYGKGFAFPADYMDDLYQSFVLALARNDYQKLRAFQGRNNCSMATFLQVVATRFALDELRKWKRHPRARGGMPDDDEAPQAEPEDTRGLGPVGESLEGEQLDIFHNLLFALEWKRVSSVLWVFEGVQRETIADVMATSRANIDALYKRAKDQMTQRFAEGGYSRNRRAPDKDLLVPSVAEPLQRLLHVPPRRIQAALLQPGAKQRALIGHVLTAYPRFQCSEAEIDRMAGGKRDGRQVAAEILEELVERVDP